MTVKLPVVANNSGISLEMAVWVLHDDYDFVRGEENYISATALMKPLRHILLPKRIPPEQQPIPDVEDYISSALGQSIHAGIEKAWLHGNHIEALERLGVPAEVVKRVFVNPTAEQVLSAMSSGLDPIPVYIEQRAKRKIVVDGVTYTVGGKFDMVCEGRVTDTKTTSVWSWIKGERREEDYRLQGSIYRWLNPDKIFEDFIRINFVFTDWSKADAAQKKDYPPRRLMSKDIPLMSVADTETWIRNKLSLLNRHHATPEKQLPECTPEELWMSPPQFKYYLDPAKVSGGYRATRNFDNLAEANAYMSNEKGGRGIIVTVTGNPRRCDYCNAYPICTQKDKYRHE